MLCQKIFNRTMSRVSFWKDKFLFLFGKWQILSQGPDILFTAYEDHQWEDLIPHKHFNIGLWIEPQMLSATGTAADLENLRPYFLLYQQQRRQGHWAWNSGDVSPSVVPGWPKPQISHGAFSIFPPWKLKPALTHCTAAVGRGIPNAAPSEPLLAFGACLLHQWSFCTQNIISNCASWHWELCPVSPDLAARA